MSTHDLFRIVLLSLLATSGIATFASLMVFFWHARHEKGIRRLARRRCALASARPGMHDAQP